jgi:hypothetical protein
MGKGAYAKKKKNWNRWEGFAHIFSYTIDLDYVI